MKVSLSCPGCGKELIIVGLGEDQVLSVHFYVSHAPWIFLIGRGKWEWFWEVDLGIGVTGLLNGEVVTGRELCSEKEAL
jgi:hypothetical protein